MIARQFYDMPPKNETEEIRLLTEDTIKKIFILFYITIAVV